MTVIEEARTFLRSETDLDHVPARPQRRLRGIRRSDALALLGAAVSAIATTILLVTVFTPIESALVAVPVCYALFLGFYAVLLSFDETMQVVGDRLIAALISSIAIILMLALFFIIFYTLDRGLGALWHTNFFTQDMTKAGPLQGLDVGGILHAMVGTLEQISIALVITVPLGLACAVFLNEFPGRFARLVRTISEAMTALPSIVAGLFIYATWILALHNDKSGFAAALALSLMMLPIIIRAADVVIRLVPASLREASYALGSSRAATVWHVVLPTARSGLTTAVILGAARGIGETSPVLLTAGFNASLNPNPQNGPQLSLPLAVFEFVKSPQPAMIARGFGAAAVLMVVVLILFLLARILGGRAPGEVTAGQRIRAQRRSAVDARRFAARAAVLSIALGGVVAVTLHPSGAAWADSYVPVSGAGSTWSQNALDDWRRNVNQYGMTINYQGTGSSDGRTQFTNGTVDFAVSEIPYGLTDGGVHELPPARPFAYMPIVAGGTSFMYNLTIGGHRVTNLRLSGDVIAGIFTGNITTWNDPSIAKDNPGLSLPGEPIIPVVRSDGSGTTAQLSTWLAKTHQSVWDGYCAKAGRSTPCGVTSFYPVIGGSRTVAQSGSLGVAGFVSQKQNEGTITYVEYSYALNTGFPVAKMLNAAGYYTEPTASNVAVALLNAKINTDLTQILDGVYSNPDPRTYPLSSYSYMIIPTSTYGSFTAAKGHTLGAFANYFLCQGQQDAPTLGYSPLPINLVQAGLDQVKRIPGVDATSIDISKCNNPTFSADGSNTLAKNAPFPQSCDKVGTVQCATGTGGAAKTTTPTKGSNAATGATGSTTGPGATGAPVAGSVDPQTGQLIDASANSGGTAMSGAIKLTSSTIDSLRVLLTILAGLILVLVVVLPPIIARKLTPKGPTP